LSAALRRVSRGGRCFALCFSSTACSYSTRYSAAFCASCLYAWRAPTRATIRRCGLERMLEDFAPTCGRKWRWLPLPGASWAVALAGSCCWAKLFVRTFYRFSTRFARRTGKKHLPLRHRYPTTCTTLSPSAHRCRSASALAARLAYLPYPRQAHACLSTLAFSAMMPYRILFDCTRMTSWVRRRCAVPFTGACSLLRLLYLLYRIHLLWTASALLPGRLLSCLSATANFRQLRAGSILCTSYLTAESGRGLLGTLNCSISFSHLSSVTPCDTRLGVWDAVQARTRAAGHALPQRALPSCLLPSARPRMS